MIKTSLSILVLGMGLQANAAIKAVNMNHTKDSDQNRVAGIVVAAVNVNGQLGRAKVIIDNYRPNMRHKLNLVTLTTIAPNGRYGEERIMHCGGAENRKVKQVDYVRPGYAYEYAQYTVRRPEGPRACANMERMLKRHQRRGGQAVDKVWIRGVLSLKGIAH